MTIHHNSQPTGSSARERLRQYWLQFEELPGYTQEDNRNEHGEKLDAGHRAALDKLVASGEISAPVADILHEAYEAAIYHIWRKRSPIMCYRVAFSYSPESAETLVKQSQVLNQIAGEGMIDPATLAKAQAALEHNMSYYALSEKEETALYEHLNDGIDSGQYPPMFEELTLKRTPEAQSAAKFIVDLLTNK
jgi:hypothetical protein